MSAEALLARQGLRATGGDGSHMSVEDAVSAQFAAAIEAFAKPAFERFRRTRQYGAVFRPVRGADHQAGRRMGDREGNRGGGRNSVGALSDAA